MKRSVAPVSAIIALFALTGCTAGLNLPGLPAASPSPEPIFISAPLTGLLYEEGTPQAQQLAKPSVACKIDNGTEAARPQIGLNSTDIVFDEMVEGGLTRLVAIWHSNQPDGVGPVRSIRPMDPDILSPFGGIVCYSGGQLVFVEAMRQAPVFNASETTEMDKGTFSRASDREAPHNVIVNVQKLANDHPELTPPPAQFSFAPDLANSSAVLTGVPVLDFSVKFPMATAKWTATTDGSRWLRTQDGKPLKDALDGEQVSAANIVVMQVRIDRSYLGKKYANVPKSIMVDTGKAWVFSGGKYLEGTWSKASATAPVVLTDAAGQNVQLNPGNTWVELMPMAPEGSIVINKAPVASQSPSPSAKK